MDCNVAHNLECLETAAACQYVDAACICSEEEARRLAQQQAELAEQQARDCLEEEAHQRATFMRLAAEERSERLRLQRLEAKERAELARLQRAAVAEESRLRRARELDARRSELLQQARERALAGPSEPVDDQTWLLYGLAAGIGLYFLGGTLRRFLCEFLCSCYQIKSSPELCGIENDYGSDGDSCLTPEHRPDQIRSKKAVRRIDGC